ncbi:hypothetical protein CTATCC11996_10113 [Comamonas testosteroni ATCC 11996]|nr:hypothetical protein CTATCC11996_10113 [Comamonas testosteroni ATCC 11996]
MCDPALMSELKMNEILDGLMQAYRSSMEALNTFGLSLNGSISSIRQNEDILTAGLLLMISTKSSLVILLWMLKKMVSKFTAITLSQFRDHQFFTRRN